MSKHLWMSLAMSAVVGQALSGQVQAQSLDSIFVNFGTDHSPGCVVGVARSGEPLAVRAYGMADLEHDVPLTSESVFHTGFRLKQFTALSILLLERDGKLGLDDLVRAHIPELPDYAATITIRQLLHHTSGLRDYSTLSSLAGNTAERVITERAFLNALARQSRLNFAPGAEHLYSNSGYVLLSLIVHRVSGRPLDEFARERIFVPLGMRKSRFQHDHAAPVPGRAIGYVRRGETWRIANSMLAVVGDAGMYSSVEDLLQWTSAWDNPAFAPLLLRMQTPGSLADGTPITGGYGMGLVQGTYRGVPTVSHSGSLPGYRANFLRLTGENVTVVTLCNNATANAARLVQMVAELYGPALMSSAAPVAGSAPGEISPGQPVPPELAQSLVGVYYSRELDAIYRIVNAPGGLTLEIEDNSPIDLRMTGPDRVGTVTAPPAILELAPVRDRDSRVIGLTLTAGRVRDIAFTRQ